MEEITMRDVLEGNWPLNAPEEGPSRPAPNGNKFQKIVRWVRTLGDCPDCGGALHLVQDNVDDAWVYTAPLRYRACARCGFRRLAGPLGCENE